MVHIFLDFKVKWSEVKVAQSCPTLCNSNMDYAVHGILQARILEWAAFSFSSGSSQSRNWTQISHIAGRLQDSLPFEPPGKPKNTRVGILSLLSDPGIEPGSPALQVDSLSAELPGSSSISIVNYEFYF